MPSSARACDATRREAARQARAGEPRRQVGINAGPTAGAVIGSLRAFYCLYGDTINTAARMCKYGGDQLHCTAAFAERVRGVCGTFIRWTSPHPVDVHPASPRSE